MIESFYPWRHLIIDNFLSEKHYKDLEKYCLEYRPKDLKDYVKFARTEITKNGEFLNHGDLDPNLAKSLFDSYVPILKKILKKYAPMKSKLFDFCTIQFTITGSDYIYHLHDDDPSKLLSTVIYLYPANNVGTDLYFNSNSKSLAKTVRWKTNRAFTFAREGRKTWHNFKGEGNENRYTLVMNLRTFSSRKALLFEPLSLKKIFLLDTYFTNKKARARIKTSINKIIGLIKKICFYFHQNKKKL